VTVVDVGLTHPGPHRLDAVPELASEPLHRPAISPNSALSACTIRTADAFSSGVYLRVVGFPGDCSFGMAPSSFPRSGASSISRAIQSATSGLGGGPTPYE
jgi:hypothetical protein